MIFFIEGEAHDHPSKPPIWYQNLQLANVKKILKPRHGSVVKLANSPRGETGIASESG